MGVPPAVRHTINNLELLLEGKFLTIINPNGSVTEIPITMLLCIQMFLAAPNVPQFIANVDTSEQTQMHEQQQAERDWPNSRSVAE